MVKVEIDAERFLVFLVVGFLGTIAFAMLVPFQVRATILKEAPLPSQLTPFLDTAFNLDYGNLQIYNLSLSWYDEYANVTYHMHVTNMTGFVNHGEESPDGTDKTMTMRLYIYNFTLTTDPLTIEVHLQQFDMYFEIHIDNTEPVPNITYQAYTTRWTNGWLKVLEHTLGWYL